MSKSNTDFFVTKREWSKVKDDLLACYLKPYVSKILHTHKPLLYIDCFAGQGMFGDGNPGSPLIALKILNECKGRTSSNNLEINAVFIELRYSEILKENLKDYPEAQVVSGSYEESIQNILKDKRDNNVFLYIDPYGIKSLHFSFFDSFSTAFNSIELLINMNSFGFIREACHVLGVQLFEDIYFEDFDEDDQETIQEFKDRTEMAINKLNLIAGGDYWKKIIDDYKSKRIDGYQAESIFVEQYCNKLKQRYKYVLNMPLRIKPKQRPKYRMIHATNHREGCLIMVDNICKRWEVMQGIQHGDQNTLWPEDFDNQPVDSDSISKKVGQFYSQYKNYVSITDSLAAFFSAYGPFCSSSEIRDALAKYEKQGYLDIRRIPEKGKNGKLSRFTIENKDHKVFVRWKNE